MNRPPMSQEFDPRIADWLEGEPIQAPGAVLDTVLAAFPSVAQRRPSRAPWRFPTMSRFALVGGAAALALVLAGALLLLRPGPNVGAPTTPPPPASPSPTASGARVLTDVGHPIAACDLVTADRAEQLAGPGLGAHATQSGEPPETSCIYRDSDGNIVLRIAYTTTGGRARFDAARSTSGAQAVTGLGDDASFDPETGTLSFVKGDSLVEIATGTSVQDPAARLAVERSVAEVAATRVASTP
jgi:hypothetical protein